MMEKVIFYADVLGFGKMSQRPGAVPAVDALSDLARVLPEEDDIARVVYSDIWSERYALSDSVFLVAEEPATACRGAAELFFNLAYVNIDSDAPVLLRGAITAGEVRRTKPLFSESGTANLVGRAVVEAVRLESSGAQGPRLLVSERVAEALESDCPAAKGRWPVERTSDGVAEILWPLRPSTTEDPTKINATMIGEICGVAVDLFLRHGLDQSIGPHYLAYFGLALRSLRWLLEHAPEQALLALEVAALYDREREIRALLKEARVHANSALSTIMGRL